MKSKRRTILIFGSLFCWLLGGPDSGAQQAADNSQPMRVDRRLWEGLDKAGATNVSLSEMICSSESSATQKFYLTRNADKHQELLKNDLTPPEINPRFPEDGLENWLEYTKKYEEKLYRSLSGKIDRDNFDDHLTRAQMVMSSFLQDRTNISANFKSQMVSDINSVKLMDAERLSRLPKGNTKNYLILSYMEVCGIDHSQINAFYTPVFEKLGSKLDDRSELGKKSKLIGHYIFICPQFLIYKFVGDHRDTEFASTIGHEVGHVIGPGKRTTLSYRDGKQIEVDYSPVYSRLHECIGKNYADQFIGFEDLIAKYQSTDANSQLIDRLKKKAQDLEADLGRKLVNYDGYFGEITADFWGNLTLAHFLNEIKDPFVQFRNLRGNLSLFCNQVHELGDGVHPSHKFRVGQTSQFPAIKDLIAKSNHWQLLNQPFCGL